MADPGPRRPADSFFPRRREAILADECAYCDAKKVYFSSDLGFREYLITGQCQTCQETPRMLPGQDPYTEEELATLYQLVSDAADEDPGETQEPDDKGKA